jgi:hypothetical protein
MSARDLRFAFLAMLILAFTLTTGVVSGRSGGTFHRHVKMKPSWPHLAGPRDMNYDHLIVPGVRVGPAALGGSVMEAVRHLGDPDEINQSTFRGPGYSSDEVYYHYHGECLWFTWQDSGIDPTIESGLRGINVDCPKWQTTTGVHVGSSPAEVVSTVARYCDTTSDGEMNIETLTGVWFRTKGRYSPITMISVMPTQTQWFGCKND